MKHVVVVIIFFLGLFLYGKFGPSIPVSVNSVSTTQPAPFSVSAEGKVTAIPDIAQISLGFTSTDTTVTGVQNQANTIINKVTSAVKNLGIDSKDIQTSNYNLSPTYDYRTPTQKLTGYTISVSIFVKVRDFSKINQVIDVGTANGANQVGGLNFTFDDPEKFQAQARKIAIDNAKQKAADIAAASGITLGKLINVSEDNTNMPRPMVTMEKALPSTGGGSVPTQVEPGSSDITSTVTLSYETR